MIVFTLSFIKNPYAHLPQNWPLLTQVSLETYQKRAFSETRFLLGFSVPGFPTEELRRADRVVGATCPTDRDRP